MAEPLDLSARYIDEDLYLGPMSVNRISGELTELAPGIGFIEAFSNVVAFDCAPGLVLFDTSLEAFAPSVVRALRRWSARAIDTICYTHGHVDHVGGAQALIDEAINRGAARPTVIAHEAVSARLERYRQTNGYNRVINQRQFASLGGGLLGAGADERFGPSSWVAADRSFATTLVLDKGELSIELHHARGETDDHAWAWIPARRAVVTGDLIVWVFPNAGNPQKVQRYPAEWAAALRQMAALEPELLLPAHGLPIAGRDRIQRVLGDTARVLELLVAQTLERMNQGATLDTCIHELELPAELMRRPYLRAVYDEPELVVRNVWRLYGGWYDGNPAHLKPPREQALALEIASLAGGAAALAKRARELGDSDARVACQLIELAALAAGPDPAVHAIRAAIYRDRREAELSLMAKGIFHSASAESDRIAKG
jgi:alkyl sulfatase BDS1-like metallo-beta-lactamase superfamily hydrolase